VEEGRRKNEDNGDEDYDSYPFVQSRKRRIAGPSFHQSTTTTLSTKTKSNIHDDTINDNEIEDILYGAGDNEYDVGGDDDDDDDGSYYDNNATFLSESPCKKKKMKHSYDSLSSSSGDGGRVNDYENVAATVAATVAAAAVTTVEELWNEMFSHLLAYHSGHFISSTDPPQGCTELGHYEKKIVKWVQEQRKYYDFDELSHERIQRLEAIGFAWNTNTIEPTTKWTTTDYDVLR